MGGPPRNGRKSLGNWGVGNTSKISGVMGPYVVNMVSNFMGIDGFNGYGALHDP